MYFEVLGDFEVLRGKDILRHIEERLGDWRY